MAYQESFKTITNYAGCMVGRLQQYDQRQLAMGHNKFHTFFASSWKNNFARADILSSSSMIQEDISLI